MKAVCVTLEAMIGAAPGRLGEFSYCDKGQDR